MKRYKSKIIYLFLIIILLTSCARGIIVTQKTGAERPAQSLLEGMPQTSTALTTTTEAVPSGLGEGGVSGGTAPAGTIAPEGLAPIGMGATSPTTEAVPSGLGEGGVSGSTASAGTIAPEGLAPIGTGATSPTTEQTPSIVTAPTITTEQEQPIAVETAPQQPLTITPQAPAPSAAIIIPSKKLISNKKEEISKKENTKEEIAMLTPAAPISSEATGVKIKNYDVIVPPVPLIFKSNEAVLPKNAENGLKAVANYMLEHKNVTLIIQGYSDLNGSESYNKELSYYRTIWVKMALERNGISSKRLLIRPMGATSKFGHTKYTYAQNRKVLLLIKR